MFYDMLISVAFAIAYFVLMALFGLIIVTAIDAVKYKGPAAGFVNWVGKTVRKAFTK